MIALVLAAAGCVYTLEVSDTGQTPWGRPVLELSTHDVTGPARADGEPADFSFSFVVANPGDEVLEFSGAAITTQGAAMCVDAGVERCEIEVEPQAPAEVEADRWPGDCRDSLALSELAPGCEREITVWVGRTEPLGLVRVAAVGGPWGSEGERLDTAPGVKQDFYQEIAVHPSGAWTDPGRLRLQDAGVELPEAAVGTATVTWVAENVGGEPITLEALTTDCAAYTSLTDPAGPLAPGEQRELLGSWDYALGESACAVTLDSDVGRVGGRVAVVPEAWLGAPSLTVTAPMPGAALASTAAVEVTASLTDPQTAASWSATLSALDGAWTLSDARVGGGELRFTLPAGLLGGGASTLQLRADDGHRTVLAALPVVVDVAPAGDDADGHAASDGDCDDTRAETYAGAAELADGLDNDCDGTVDEGSAASDDDGDGVTEDAGDRDDADASTYPGAAERCDGVDNDADGVVDNGTECADADGDGWSAFTGDCDDADATAHPEAMDHCGEDHDCDGVAAAPCAWSDELRVLGLGVDVDVCSPGDVLDVVLYATGGGVVSLSGEGVVDAELIDATHARITCGSERGIDEAVYGLFTDSAGGRVWTTADLEVLRDGQDLDATFVRGGETMPACGCDALHPRAVALVGGLGLMAWRWRRRRRR